MKSSKKFKSDYEQFVSEPSRKELVEVAYEELSLSELIHELMERESISVRALAKKMGVSPTVVQNARSNRHSNLTLRTLLGITDALGARLRLEIGDRVVTLMK